MKVNTKNDDTLERQWLCEKDVALLLSRSVSSLQKDRHKCRGISFVKLGRSVRYAYADVMAYMEARKIKFDNY